jgi:hypothetical protein
MLLMADPIEDQIDAAEQEAIRLQSGLKKEGFVDWEAGETVKAAIEAWRQYTLTKPIIFCTHATEAPDVRYGLLDQPGYIYCHDCHIVAAYIRTQMNPLGCEACGQQIPENAFAEVFIQLGNFILHGNICYKCAGKEESK